MACDKINLLIYRADAAAAVNVMECYTAQHDGDFDKESSFLCSK